MGDEGGGGKEGRSQRTRELAARYEGLLFVPRPSSRAGKKNPRRCAHLSDSVRVCASRVCSLNA